MSWGSLELCISNKFLVAAGSLNHTKYQGMIENKEIVAVRIRKKELWIVAVIPKIHKESLKFLKQKTNSIGEWTKDDTK
jgi:hypothetical protein